MHNYVRLTIQKCCAKFHPYLSRKRLVFSIAKRLSTIEKCCCYINHHYTQWPPPLVAMEIFLDMFYSPTQWYHHIFLEMFQSQNIYIYVPIRTKLRVYLLKAL